MVIVRITSSAVYSRFRLLFARGSMIVDVIFDFTISYTGYHEHQLRPQEDTIEWLLELRFRLCHGAFDMKNAVYPDICHYLS